eukprot:COSAG05_NODE_1795_length_4077_cov_2.741830_2_plen_233_part_00
MASQLQVLKAQNWKLTKLIASERADATIPRTQDWVDHQQGLVTESSRMAASQAQVEAANIIYEERFNQLAERLSISEKRIEELSGTPLPKSSSSTLQQHQSVGGDGSTALLEAKVAELSQALSAVRTNEANLRARVTALETQQQQQQQQQHALIQLFSKDSGLGGKNVVEWVDEATSVLQAKERRQLVLSEECRAIFDQMDHDGSSIMERDEVSIVIRSLSLSLSLSLSATS